MDLPPPCDPSDKKSFAYTTVLKRWPTIITNLIDCVYNVNHELSTTTLSSEGEALVQERIAEGKSIIEKASQLKYRMSRDHPLEPIPDDGGSHVELYNTGLEELAAEAKNTWYTTPWLWAECYLYRLIRTWFSLTVHWTQFDPFFALKEQTFQGSGTAVYKLAYTMQELDVEAEKSSLDSDLKRLEVLFDEMIQMCFWGNATDLSLLTTLSTGDIEKLQSVGKEAQAASRQFILRNDIDVAWNYLSTLKDARLDIVLDNSGFEYFTDLILADFLVKHTPFFSSVVFHPKEIPWFVSDVTPPDARALLVALASIPSDVPKESPLPSSYYFTSPPPSEEHLKALHKLHYRWLKYFEDGTFKLHGCPGLDGDLSGGQKGQTHPQTGIEFWTRPDSYRALADYPDLAGLEGSGLAIFKGDLNYRKLTGDLKWPPSTPFNIAVGPLAGKIPILSLRTNKADVIVGLKEGLGESMDAESATTDWRVSGRYGVITFEPSSQL